MHASQTVGVLRKQCNASSTLQSCQNRGAERRCSLCSISSVKHSFFISSVITEAVRFGQRLHFLRFLKTAYFLGKNERV